MYQELQPVKLLKSKRQQRRILKIRAEKFVNDIQIQNTTHVSKETPAVSEMNAPSTSSNFINSNPLISDNEDHLDSTENSSSNLLASLFSNGCVSSSPNDVNESSDSELSDISFIEEYQNNTSSADFLRNWALKHNVTHTALSDLLSWFITNPDISKLPKDARTLLRTPRKLNIQPMGNGKFYYFGLYEGLLKCYEKHKSTNVDTFCLDFNIDGIPIHKSTPESFWPILCRVTNFSRDQPFPVAIFCGPTKPPLNDFFVNFIKELKPYLSKGLKISETVTLKIVCRSFCCDTPARSFVKGVKGHNAYYGCDKCCVKGDYIHNKVVFPNDNAELRTDEKFCSGQYGDYNKVASPLLELEIGLVSSFPIDYMHSICLGVVRKLLLTWRDGNRHLYRFKMDKLNLFEKRLEHISKQHYWPFEMDRKPRSISQLEHWKAVEFQHFLLYVSSLLVDVLPNHHFCNLMLLRFGVTILLSPTLNNKYNEYAGQLLRLFVSNAIQIYGKEFCVYNVHSVIHLAEDAKLFGSLNLVNCFVFENYLGFLKRLLRKSNQNLEQVVKRIFEGKTINKRINNHGISVIGQPFRETDGNIYYKKIIFNDLTISTKKGDNCVFLSDNVVAEIKSIYVESETIYIHAFKFKDIKPFISYPVDSSIISLFQISSGSDEVTVHANNISNKAIVLPLNINNDTFVCCPYVHSI